MIEPKEIEIADLDGSLHRFEICKMPATYAQQVVIRLPKLIIAKGQDAYDELEGLMLGMLRHATAIRADGSRHPLITKALIDQPENVASVWVLAQLEEKMLEHSTGFFLRGKISSILDFVKADLPKLVSEILSQCLGRLSQKEEQHSQN